MPVEVSFEVPATETKNWKEKHGQVHKCLSNCQHTIIVHIIHYRDEYTL